MMHELWERIRGEAFAARESSDEAIALGQGELRWEIVYRILVGISLALILGACGQSSYVSEGEAGAGAVPTMELSSSELAPGDEFAVTIEPHKYCSGRLAFLDASSSNGWNRIYALVQPLGDRKSPSYTPYKEPFFEHPVAECGDRTYQLVMPPVSPGEYRVSKVFSKRGNRLVVSVPVTVSDR